MNTSLTINFTPPPDEDKALEEWLHLEQEIIPEVDQVANLSDVAAMLDMVKSGLSASLYGKSTCPVTIIDDVIKIDLNIYVFPYRTDLAYEISASFGKLSEGVVYEPWREFSIIVPMTTQVSMDYVIADYNFEWETEVRNQWGRVITPPTITVENGHTLDFGSEPVFGVVRFKGRTLGFSHIISLTLVPGMNTREELEEWAEDKLDDLENDSWLTDFFKELSDPPESEEFGDWGRDFFGDTITATTVDEEGEEETEETVPINNTGYKYSNINSTISVVWYNEEGKKREETKGLEIPECVKDFLGTCGDELANTQHGTIINIKPKDTKTVVYYSTCTGKVIEVRYE